MFGSFADMFGSFADVSRISCRDIYTYIYNIYIYIYIYVRHASLCNYHAIECVRGGSECGEKAWM